MKIPRHPAPSRALQRGLTLIELLVGLALGLIVTAALLMLFANASVNGQNLARSGIQIENGRFVSELLREDITLAGFYGESSVIDATGFTHPDPCSTTPNAPVAWNGATFVVPAHVHGYGPADALGCLSNRKPNTYAIAVRRLAVDSVDPATLAAGNTQYYLQYSFCNGDTGSPRFIFDKDPAALVLRNRACTGPNTARAYVSRIYYVATCNRCGTDSTPTLKRVELVGDRLVTTALAEGIDELRFEYGIDTNNDGSADSYPVLPTTGWENVMTVKLHFITRSLDKVVGSGLATAQQFQLGGTGTVNIAADGYTRRAYTTVVRLVNPSAAREVQP